MLMNWLKSSGRDGYAAVGRAGGEARRAHGQHDVGATSSGN